MPVIQMPIDECATWQRSIEERCIRAEIALATKDHRAFEGELLELVCMVGEAEVRRKKT